MTVAPYAISFEAGALSLAPIMVVGDSDAARRRAERQADATGRRVLPALSPAGAIDALAEQVSLGALWVEFDEVPDAAGRRLLARMDEDARRMGVGTVVCGRLEFVDDLFSEVVFRGDTQLLIDANEPERVAAMQLACVVEEGLGVRDAASDGSAARLRQLSEEVSRIAAALSRLGTLPSGPPLSPATMAPPREDVPNVSAEALRTIIRARRMRANFFPEDLFADPAWDMLLDLMQAEIVQHRVPVSSLCIAAAVPATTALRWIKAMTDRGLLLRRDDPHDGRRVFIEMAPTTSTALRRYFHEVGMAAV